MNVSVSRKVYHAARFVSTAPEGNRLFANVALREVDVDGRAAPRLGFGGNGVAELREHLFAQIQPDAARLQVAAPVEPRVALFEHARQILRRDAYSGVFDTKDFSLGINLYAPLAGIFERV